MLGIIGAMDIEVKGIIEKMESPEEKNISGMKFTSGKICGTDCVIAKCGIGKVNAAMCAQTMILLYHPEKIINTGIAGSTCGATHIGSVVIGKKVVQHDFDTVALGDEKGTLFLPEENIVYIPCDPQLCDELADACAALGDIDFTTGNIATGDLFVATRPQRAKLNSKFEAIACEMEGGSIGQVCYINKVPFCVLRSISDDSSSDEGAEVEYSTFARSAAEKAIEILMAYIQRSKV